MARVYGISFASSVAVLAALAACSSDGSGGGLSQRRAGTGEYATPAASGDAGSPAPASAPAPTASAPAPADAGSAPKDAASAPVEVQVSSLTFTEENGYGPVEKNMSNGEDGAMDGNTITLDNTTYATGLGVHANSKVTVALAAGYTTFLADVGVDDEVGDMGSVVFQVVVDGAAVFDSGAMTGATPKETVSVDVKGKQTLELVVTDADDGNAYDHADWANARLVK